MRKGRSPLAIVALLAGLGPSRADAQVNVERLRGDLRVAPATATLEGSFTGRSGNVQNVVVGAGAIGAARIWRHSVFFSAQADYATFEGQPIVSKSFVHVRYDYKLVDWLFAEAFGQQQQDKFQRLLVRELLGTGPRFLLVNTEDLRVAYGAGYMLEYERISVAEGATDAPESVAHRHNSYLSTTWQPDGGVRVLATIYVQPRFDAWDDARVLFETSLVTDVVDRLGVKVLATVRHDTEPPTGVKRTDIEVKNALVLKF